MQIRPILDEMWVDFIQLIFGIFISISFVIDLLRLALKLIQIALNWSHARH